MKSAARRLPALGTLALATAVAACRLEDSPVEAAAVEERIENYLVILVDDWALSDWELSRADANPWNDLVNVESVAAVGLEWRNFHAQPSCSPTRKSLLFGTYLSGNASLAMCSKPAAAGTSPPSLPGILAEQGFATAAFGKWHVRPGLVAGEPWQATPGDFGFGAWRAWNGGNLEGHCRSNGYFDWYRVDDGVGTATTEYHTEAVGRAVCDWWQATEGPRFAYVGFAAPHSPLHVPPAHLLPPGYPTPASPRERYEAMLVAMDTVLGMILDVVDTRDTCILLLGDNGTPPEALHAGQSPGRAKKSGYEDGVNVPLIACLPGGRRGETEALGHVVDVMGTIASLAGVELPMGAAVDTVSLEPVLRDPSARVRESLVCERSERQPVGKLFVRDGAVVAARGTSLLKAVFLEDEVCGIDRIHLYDLTLDPGETAPLVRGDPAYADDIAHLEDLLAAYRARR